MSNARLWGSLASLARRPKDVEGPAAITHRASIGFFVVSLFAATLAMVANHRPELMLSFAALGVAASWLLALTIMASVPRARWTLFVQTPFVIVAVAYLLFG